MRTLITGIALWLLSAGLAATATATEDLTHKQRLREAGTLGRAAPLFEATCAGCHRPGGGVEIADIRQVHAALRFRHEEDVAARWAALPDADQHQIAAYAVEAMTEPPLGDAALGRQLYARTCSVCHGEEGNGASWARHALNPPPSDFTGQAVRRLSRADMIRVVSEGRPGTAMMGFRAQLDRTEIAALVDYIRTAFVGAHGHDGIPDLSEVALAPGIGPAPPDGAVDMALGLPGGITGDPARGEELYMGNCTACHGSDGDGQGPRAYFMTPKPAAFTQTGYRSALNRPRIFNSISDGVRGSEMPAWRTVLTTQQIADLAEYVFQTFVTGPDVKKN